jgi:hypothetical protein
MSYPRFALLLAHSCLLKGSLKVAQPPPNVNPMLDWAGRQWTAKQP